MPCFFAVRVNFCSCEAVNHKPSFSTITNTSNLGKADSIALDKRVQIAAAGFSLAGRSNCKISCSG
jgi:hypothetical protein